MRSVFLGSGTLGEASRKFFLSVDVSDFYISCDVQPGLGSVFLDFLEKWR